MTYSAQDFADLKNVGSDVFLYEVHKKSDRVDGDLRVNNALFWSDVYQEHLEDEDALRAFISSTHDVLCISGRLGSGKTTYLWRHIQHIRPCDIVLVDLVNHPGVFGARGAQTRIELTALLSTTLRQRLFDNIRYRQWISRPEASEAQKNLSVLAREDVFNRIGIDLPELDIPGEELAREQQKAEIKLAVMAAKYLDSEEVLTIFRDFDILPDINDSHYNQVLEDKAALQFAIAGNRNRLFEALTWVDLLTLYQECFCSRPPTMLAFDNLDIVAIRSIQADFTDALFEISNEANRRYRTSINERRFLETKLMFSIRHENITRINVSGGHVDRVYQIALDKSDRALPIANVRHLSFDGEFASKTLRKRLAFLKRRLPNNSLVEIFDTIASSFWTMTHSDGNMEIETVPQFSGSINNYEFCNNSMRIFLLAVYSTTLSVLKHRLENDIPHHLSRSTRIVSFSKGRLIRAMQDNPLDRRIPDAFFKGIRAEIEGAPCCIYRSVLTTLYCNSGPDNVDIVAQLVSDVFGHSRDAVLETIYSLYMAPTYTGDLIDIHQQEYIDSMADVDPMGEVSITPRGRQFLRAISISIDYFGGYGGGPAVLAELSPARALPYLNSVSELLIRLARQHTIYWHREVRPRIRDTGQIDPVAYYYRRHSVGRMFYSARSAASHENSILAYIIEVLKGPDCQLAISADDLLSLREHVPTNLVPADIVNRIGDGAGTSTVLIPSIGRVLDGLAPFEIHDLYQDVLKTYHKIKLAQQSYGQLTAAELESVDIEAYLNGFLD